MMERDRILTERDANMTDWDSKMMEQDANMTERDVKRRISSGRLFFEDFEGRDGLWGQKGG